MMKLQPSSSSSSSKAHTHQHLAALKAETNIDSRKQQHKGTEEKSSRHPFRDLNNHIICGIGSDPYISSSSSMSSVEAPKGCLRFCLSHSSYSSSTSNKTPSNVSARRTSNSSRRRPNKVKTFSFSKAPNLKPTSSSKEISSKRPTSGKPNSQKCLYQRKKPILMNDPSAARESGSGELKYLGVVDNAINLTPSSKRATRSTSKTAVCSDTKSVNSLDFNNDASEKAKTYSFETISESSGNTMTPPIEASVSPEIQCGFSKLSAATTTTETTTITPPCYGAGHLLSGITDKRKCRARGLLVVGEAKPLANFDSDDDHGTKRLGVAMGNEEDPPASLLPLPIAASMHWHLSPCRKQGEECRENSEDGSSDFRRLEDGTKFSSPVSYYSYSGLPSHLCDNSTAFVSTSFGNISKERMKACLISPYELTEPQGALGSALLDNLGVSPSGVGKKSFPDLNEDTSPFSIDSFGSGNVMQTPHSNSSLDTRIAMPLRSEDGNKQRCNFDADLDVLTEHLQRASVSPKRDVPLMDQACPSFQFDCLITPSGSVDVSWFQKVLDDDATRFSGSTMDTVPQSHLRISWREGLASRMFEMDEIDCCTCLSDEEEDYKGLNNACLESHCSHQLIAHDPFSSNGLFSREVAVAERGVHGKTKERIPSKVTCSCAESISTDGGGFICSDDSDWALCYKNQLFLE